MALDSSIRTGVCTGQHRSQKAKQTESDLTVAYSYDTNLGGGNRSLSFEEYAGVPEVATTALGRELGVYRVNERYGPSAGKIFEMQHRAMAGLAVFVAVSTWAGSAVSQQGTDI